MPEPKPKAKKIGRPTLPKAHAKSSIVPVRFNEAGRKRIEAAAKEKGQTVSDFIRRVVEDAMS